MTSVAVVIFGLRITEELIRNRIAQLERNFPDAEIGGYEDWDLQELAQIYQLPLIVVRRSYHDGDTSDRNELIANCPVYIGFSYCTDSGFNPHDLLRDISQENLANLNNLLLDLGAHDGDYQFQFNLNTFDIDAGIITYNPIGSPDGSPDGSPIRSPDDVNEPWSIDSDLEDCDPDSP